MKVFVAGATGAIGRQLVPQLVAAGHEVVGMTRSESKRDLIRGLGAEPAVADALDPDAVAQAVARAEPDVVVHQLTSLTSLDMRKLTESFGPTNRLRTEGTDHLLAAARAVGARRFVAQSFAGYVYAPTRARAVSEEQRWADPPEAFRESLDAIRYLESAVTRAADIEGLVLRYGGFYGPGTSVAPGGEHLDAVRKRAFPLVGDGGGIWSFVHIEDAAEATAIAVERGAPGIYNIVDDEPTAVRDWLPELAAAAGAKPPRRVPRWFARIVGGELMVVMMTEVSGASNAKAKRELGWQPRRLDWREVVTAAEAA